VSRQAPYNWGGHGLSAHQGAAVVGGRRLFPENRNSKERHAGLEYGPLSLRESGTASLGFVGASFGDVPEARHQRVWGAWPVGHRLYFPVTDYIFLPQLV
jgi:hypothetical protein